MARDATAEGIKRGDLLVGPLGTSARRYLFFVNKVNGAHSVNALCRESPRAMIEINLHTHGIYEKDSPWRKVEYLDRTESEIPVVGHILDTQIKQNMQAEVRRRQDRKERGLPTDMMQKASPGDDIPI